MEEGRRKKEEGRGKKEEGWVAAQRGYRRLIAWQKSQALASSVYVALRQERLPHWLEDQVGRSAGSVHANIAEGYTRSSLRDYLRFLDIARSSLAELESHLYFMANNNLLDAGTYAELDKSCSEVGNILVGLMRSLTAKLKDGSWNRLSEEAAEYTAASAWDDLLPPSSFLLPSGEGQEG